MYWNETFDTDITIVRDLLFVMSQTKSRAARAPLHEQTRFFLRCAYFTKRSFKFECNRIALSGGDPAQYSLYEQQFLEWENKLKSLSNEWAEVQLPKREQRSECDINERLHRRSRNSRRSHSERRESPHDIECVIWRSRSTTGKVAIDSRNEDEKRCSSASSRDTGTTTSMTSSNASSFKTPSVDTRYSDVIVANCFENGYRRKHYVAMRNITILVKHFRKLF